MWERVYLEEESIVEDDLRGGDSEVQNLIVHGTGGLCSAQALL
jgi:hypothetical protein